MKEAKTDKPKTDLHIFDFDQTMMSTPGPPPGLKKERDERGVRHWDDPESLEHPVVPQHPNENWWVQETLEAYKRARKNPSNHIVVMTGRQEHLRPQVQALLEKAGIEMPDELVLKPTAPPGEKAEETKPYKIREMKRLLEEHPHVKKVHFWEDRDKHLESFQEEAEKAGYHFVPHYVTPVDEKKEWQTYLDNFWEGGQKTVPNPDPKTREQYPEITVEYAMKKFPDVRKRLQERYQRWRSMGSPTHKGPKGNKQARVLVGLTHWRPGAEDALATEVAQAWLLGALRSSQ